MIRLLLLPLLVLLSGPSMAESLVAARAIIGGTVISAADIQASHKEIVGAASDPSTIIGREARVTIYAGRPIRTGDFRAPALIERNDVVRLRYRNRSLIIETDGRALGRGAAGDRISVMNLTSRSTLIGKVLASGFVEVER